MSFYWRLVTVAVIAILLATFIGFFVTEKLDRIESSNAFTVDISAIHQEINQESTFADAKQIIAEINNEQEFPYSVSIALSPKYPVGHKNEIGTNQFEVWYQFKDTKYYFGYADKYENGFIDEELADEIEAGNLSDLEKLIILLLTTILVSIGFIGISGSVKKQISALQTASERIGEGDLSQQITGKFQSPFDHFANTFNQMQSKISSLVNQYKTFSFAIPHELRTPLSKVRFALDLSRNYNSIEEYKVLVEKLDGYTDDLEQLIEDMLELTKQDSPLPKETIKLADIINKVCSENPELKKQLSIVLADQEIKIVANPNAMSRVLLNLFENSAKFGATQIDIHTQKQLSYLSIFVGDNGRGIAAENSEHIFQAFNRAGEKAIDGTGLGLSLCKMLLQRQEANIQLVTGKSSGACFEITIPN